MGAYAAHVRDPDSSITALATTLLERTDHLANDLAARIAEQVPFYRSDGPIERNDLVDSCRDNLQFMIGRLGALGPPDLSAPRRTGSRRAGQGAPLSSVLAAFRIGFAFMWDVVAHEAQHTGLVSDAELVRAASDIWTLNEMFTTEMVTAYWDVMTERAVREDQTRSALVAALLEGTATGVNTAWEAADLLSLPYRGRFVVVVAETVSLARPPLPNIEHRLSAKDIGSAWRLRPDHQVGIVSLRPRTEMAALTGILSTAATGRIGLSPVYTNLEKTPEAMHLARIAMASIPAHRAEVCVFDDSPTAALVASSPTTAYRIAQRTLGPVLDLEAELRDMLLDTIGAYYAAKGSTVDMGKRLFCHPNTVRLRLRRIEQLTGASFDDPVASAELYIALEALRRLPEPAQPG